MRALILGLRAGSRGRLVRAAVIACLCAAPALGALPATATAAGASAGSSSTTSSGSSSLGSGLAPTVPTVTSTDSGGVEQTTTSSGSGGGFSTAGAIAIALAASLIILGIVVAIFRDARRRTRGRRAPSVDAERIPGSKRPPKARKLSPAERRRRKRGRAPRR